MWWWWAFGRYALLSRSFFFCRIWNNVMTAQHLYSAVSKFVRPDVRDFDLSWSSILHTTFWPFVLGSNESGRKLDWRVGFLHSPTAVQIALSSIMSFRWSCWLPYSTNFGVQALFYNTVITNVHESFASRGYFAFILPLGKVRRFTLKIYFDVRDGFVCSN